MALAQVSLDENASVIIAFSAAALPFEEGLDSAAFQGRGNSASSVAGAKQGLDEKRRWLAACLDRSACHAAEDRFEPRQPLGESLRRPQVHIWRPGGVLGDRFAVEACDEVRGLHQTAPEQISPMLSSKLLALGRVRRDITSAVAELLQR